MIRPFFAGCKAGFHTFGQTIASVVNGILLTLVYFIGVGPTSLIAKARKVEFLDLGKKKKKSYWVDKKVEKQPLDDYYRQF